MIDRYQDLEIISKKEKGNFSPLTIDPAQIARVNNENFGVNSEV